MGFTRTEIRVEVTGAEEGARAMRGLAAAEDKVSESAIRERLAVQDAEQAIVRKVRAEQAAKKELEALLNPTKELTKETGLLAKAGEFASSGLTMLRKAAEVIPGVELGTIIAGAAAGLYGLYKLFQDTTTQTGMMTDAMKAYGVEVARVVKESTRQFDDLRVSQARAGLSLVGGSLGVSGEQLPFEQAMGAQALQQRLESAREAQRKALEGVAELERRKAALDFDRAKAGELLPTDPVAIELRRRQIEINEQRRGYRAVYDAAASDLRRLTAPYQSQAAPARRALPRAVSMLAVPGPTTTPMFSIAPAPGEDLTPRGIDNVVSLDAWKAKRAAEAAAQAQQVFDQRNAMMAGHSTPVGAPAMPEVPSLLKMMTATDEERAAFDQQMADAGAGIKGLYSETQRLADDGVNMLSGLGRGLSQAAAASLLTGKSFRAAANELLKSLAVQAAGQAIWETALGVGSLALAAFGNPAAAASASLHFKAAGMFAGLSIAFAGGAGITGGMRGSGGGASAGGGGGMASAAGTNPYRSEASAPQPIHIHIGSETVTRVVDGERRREARRDGISAREAA